MTLSHIVAAADNDVIGTANSLPWNIPEDMKFFRETTRGRIIIMGRKTYASMGKALPGRLNIVITRSPDFNTGGLIVVPSLALALKEASKHLHQYGSEVFIIGGGEIYAQSIDIVDTIYLTRIHQSPPGDTHYPKVDPLKFQEADRRPRNGFTFFTFKRRQAPI